MNAAELFVRCLENEGVEYIFGVPGEENAHFMIALEDSPIKFILCRHEQGAAFIADAYGRLTGRVGVCLGTLGPGATNLVTGVADANMDRSPLVVITGQADSRRQHKESHQNMDVVGMFDPITKWAQPILHTMNIPEVVRKAFKLAQTEKPGACHIELADDIAAFEVDSRPVPVMNPRRPVPADKVIDQAVELIRNAKTPVILAGNGAVRKRACKQLRKLAETTGIGVISTFMGKGSVSRHAPYSLFTIGLQSRDYAWEAVDQADLVITLGYDLVEYPPRIWNQCECKDTSRKIIHIDFLPAETDEHYPVTVEVVGDLAHSLWMLNERLKASPLPRYELSLQRELRGRMLDDLAEHKDDDTEGLIRPQKVLWDVREAMGPDDILLSDVGAHKMWVARYYHCDQPNTCLISNGFCSMGFALPAAIGAKLVHPDRNILAICGDGGFLMNVQELETARRIGANIVIMIWEDGGYGLIEWKQQMQFGRHTDLHFNNPDFVKLAESFDCLGYKVEKARDLLPTLEKAFAADRPVLISVPIDYRENIKLSKRLGKIQCVI
ncbi:MAG: acetolactate synthase large subunit [Proteobacteria bacterium]|nr:acetolactate synthase large subunit [Pseudomonadota bacterium]MBU1736673.1 acetolactate synthase large subunit [Pseudomonadota bacterium]